MFEEYATGRFTKQEVLARVTERGVRTRHGLVLSPQSFGQMLRNVVYVGQIRSPQCGGSTRADFDPLVSERTTEGKEGAAEIERRVKAVQQKLDRLDEAFVYAQSIDRTSDVSPETTAI
jgi:hypothetical protein